MKRALKVFAALSFAVYAFALVSVLFVYSRGHFDDLTLTDYIRYSSNIIPFRSISLYIGALFDSSMNIETPILNLFGNLLMFLPMGLYLPYFFRGLRRFGRFCICMAAALLVIEAAQLLLRAGSFDIDDVILNIAGAFAGFGIWKVLVRITCKRGITEKEDKATSEQIP